MELATFIGIPISEFWEMTPYELSIAAKGYAKRQEIKRKEMTYQSYLLSRWVWTKNINIKQILKNLETKKEKKEMTPEQMLARVKMLNAMFGGEVKTCNS